MRIAVLFIIGQMGGNQTPLGGEWASMLWPIQTAESFSARKRNELSSREETQRDRGGT